MIYFLVGSISFKSAKEVIKWILSSSIENDGNYIDEEIEIFKKVVEQGAAHFYEIASEGGLESA